MMIAGSTLTRVATPTTAKKSPPSEGIFGVPQTGVPGTNFDLSSDFSIFSPKCGQGEHPFGFPKLNGPRTAVLARFSDRIPPYGIFLLLLATLIWPQFSRKATPQGRSGILICPIYLYKADRFIIILSHYNYNIFFYKNQPDRFSFSRSVKMAIIFIIPKKFYFVKAAPILIDFYKKK